MTILSRIPGGKLSKRKIRRVLRLSEMSARRARVTRSFSEQWKRYPNSRIILRLRSGEVTHTGIYPKGYDPYHSADDTTKEPILGRVKDRLANHPDVDKIILSDTDPFKGVVLTLWSYNIVYIERFKYLCRANLPKELQAFHQSNARTFQMFELWNPHGHAMIFVADQIARAMGLKLIVDLKNRYSSRGEVLFQPFQKFDDDLHSFGEFFGN